MTTTEPSAATSVSSALAGVGRATHWVDLEMAWIEGLRHCKRPADRDRIMAAAGRRLRVFDEVPEDRLRLTWLSDIAGEVRSRADLQLGEGLGALAITELREALARINDDLEALRKSTEAGESIRQWTRNNVAASNRVRDLGRTAKKLSGSGLLALMPAQDADLAIRLADDMASGGRLVATVPDSLRVRREDLIGWARRPEAASHLPALLRRLVGETTDVERIDFPSGSGIAAHGWDGIVDSMGGHQFVPAGESGWEVSTQQSRSGGKARDDYRKRVGQLSPEQRRGLNYVAVICAPWTKARDFEREMRARRDFRQVYARNVDHLEAWLECAPQTTVWLRELMGDPVAGIRPLSAWWAKWLEDTSPALDAAVVLAGRAEQAETLRERCRQPRGGVVTVGGQAHRDEVIAFVAAALVPSNGSDSAPADVLYADDHSTAERLLASAAPGPRQRPLTVLVPSNEFAQHLPAASPHRMIVPIPGASQADIVLAPVDNEDAARAFEATGIEHADAHRLGSLARMSLMAARRALAKQPALWRPRWVSGHVDRALRRCLLLGGWDAGRTGDRRAVEEFAGCPYEDTTEMLCRLDPGDAPMRETGGRWHVVSPADAWLLLDGQLTGDDIAALGDAAFEVLTAPDPLWGLAGDERLRAQLDGTRSRFSPQIKSGVATTLALLGSRPPMLRGAGSASSGTAAGIVWRILRSANDDASPRTWDAVAEVLPLLAEADPEAVLSGLRTCMSGRHAFAGAMFADSRSEQLSFSALSPHTRVLAALELVAWSPDCLMTAVDVLATLAEIDPGGQYANRPAENLSSILSPWLPRTSACAEDRLEALQMLRRCHGAAAWPLMLSMLPGGQSHQVRGDGPRFRDWRRAERPVARQEHAHTAACVADMLLEDVGGDSGRWADLIEALPRLPPDARRRACTALDRLADVDADKAFKPAVWPKLRDLVDLHRQYRDADWLLPDSDLRLCERLLERLRPAEPSTVYGRLFSPGLRHIDGVGAAGGWDSFQQALRAKQAEAVATILATGGVGAVLEFAETVEQPGAVGAAMASRDASLDEAVLASMDAARGAVTPVALGYFKRRFAELGWHGLQRLLADCAPPPQVAADLLRSPPAAERAWTRVDSLGGEVAAEYWARVDYYDLGVPEDAGDLVEVSGRLREAGRCEQATILLSLGAADHESRPEFAQEAAACLEQLTEQPLPALWSTQAGGMRLTTLLDALDRHRAALDTGRAAAIEWQLYPLVHNMPCFRSPNLYREMARDPELFVRLIEMAFRPAGARGTEQPAPTDAQQSVALHAHRALHGWPESRFIPGPDDAGGVDAERLGEWVERARERLAAIDRAEVGDIMIGTALAASPAGPDGEWPTAAVRDLIEMLQSDDIDDGIYTAIRNQRGVTRRSLTAGGDQERELAAGLRHKALRFRRWTRTAAIFEHLTLAYEHAAGIEDREAEAHRRGLPL